MKIISFDVGIKNMAYCIFTTHQNEIEFSPTETEENKTDEMYSMKNRFQIVDWNVVSLIEKNEPSIYCNCSSIAIKKTSKKKLENFFTASVDTPKLCCRVAKYKKGNQTFCEKHSKTQTEWRIPESRFKTIKKMNIENMNTLATELGIINVPKKKADVLNLLQGHIKNICLEPVVEKQMKSAGDTDLVSIGKNMKNIFNNVLENHKDITHVLIENQISPLANRMKTVQGMLSQYFIMTYDTISIEFISSSNKLKMFSTKKAGEQIKEESQGKTQSQKYKTHKKDGIYHCEKVLENNTWICSSQWINTDKKKKDDLADCFLQGLWYLQK